MALSIDGVIDGFGGLDRWSQEARFVSLLADKLGVAVDDEALMPYDVRELMSLQLRLQQALRKNARPWDVVNRRRAARTLRGLSCA